MIRRLIRQLGTPAGVLQSGARVGNLPGIGQRTAALLGDQNLLAAARQRAHRELESLVKLDVALLSCESPDFPEALHTIADSPILLYCRGALSWLERPAVAIIGARTATDYGQRVASLFAAELAAQGITIISGAAYGIDAAAHRGALQSGGGTVAVLGCGIDVAYPRSHAALLREIAGNGLLLTEYPLGTPPEGFRFPARNRLISGLAQGVVVVEATEKSGSLITAQLALDQGREVFAVPGRIDSPKSAGAHRLIQQGAHLVQSTADILAGLSWGTGVRTSTPPPGNRAAMPPLAPGEQLLLDNLDTYPRDIDTLVRATGLAPAEIHALLLQLELQGLVRPLPGQQYERRSVP